MQVFTVLYYALFICTDSNTECPTPILILDKYRVTDSNAESPSLDTLPDIKEVALERMSVADRRIRAGLELRPCRLRWIGDQTRKGDGYWNTQQFKTGQF